MENITLRYVYDRKGIGLNSKPQSLCVEVRINKTNKAAYINTGIKLFPNQFSKLNGFTCKNHDRAAMITQKARNVFNQVYDFANSNKCTSLDQVKNYNKTIGGHQSVVDFMRDRLRKSDPTISPCSGTIMF